MLKEVTDLRFATARGTPKRPRNPRSMRSKRLHRRHLLKTFLRVEEISELHGGSAI
jgi:hypothetical protein